MSYLAIDIYQQVSCIGFAGAVLYNVYDILAGNSAIFGISSIVTAGRAETDRLEDKIIMDKLLVSDT